MLINVLVNVLYVNDAKYIGQNILILPKWDPKIAAPKPSPTTHPLPPQMFNDW